MIGFCQLSSPPLFGIDPLILSEAPLSVSGAFFEIIVYHKNMALVKQVSTTSQFQIIALR